MQFDQLRRREFITLLGAWSCGRARRVRSRPNECADRVLVRRREPSHCSPYVRPLVLVFFMA
jgi:hypothetical protein